MGEFVELYSKRNRGWPWPEDSWGLTPMYGEDGWCRSCGVPLRAQCGSLVMQGKGLARIEGAWAPNWQFDAICLERSLADVVDQRYDVELLDVGWHGTSRGQARQIVVPSVGERWFEPDELAARARTRHGTAGARCPDCAIWRWMGLGFPELPPLRVDPGLGDVDIAASPEWFGDGFNAFRQLLVRRGLAELIAAASPADFAIASIA